MRQAKASGDEVTPKDTQALEAEVLNAWFESDDGEIALTADQGEPCTVRMDVQFRAAVENPIFSVTLQNETSQTVFSTNTAVQRIATGRFEPGARAQVRIRFDNRLAPGRYRLFATVARAGLGADVFDAHVSNSIVVVADRTGGGIADLEHTFEVEQA
jgi:hypothetical protein